MKNDYKAMSESLRPHFVFNVMNILRYIIKKDAAKASDMVYDLSLYMRCKLDALESDREIPFYKAWDIIEAYLRLEQVALPNLKYTLEGFDEEYSLNAGEFLEVAEQLVKEQVRVTKEIRTLRFIPSETEAGRGVKIMVEETNVWIQL